MHRCTLKNELGQSIEIEKSLWCYEGNGKFFGDFDVNFCPKCGIFLHEHYKEVTEVIGSEWISIKDHLPEKEGIYGVLRNWSPRTFSVGECYFNGNLFEDELAELAGEIIYWMSLPEPPEV